METKTIPSATEIQWRNIRKVVQAVAEWAFGSKDDPQWGAAYVTVVNSVTAKDGIKISDLKLESLAEYKHTPTGSSPPTQSGACKHCGGAGHTKAGRYLARCVCQMTPEQLDHQVEYWINEEIKRRQEADNKPKTTITTDEEAAKFIESKLWEAIDMNGAFPAAKIDPRTWGHVLVYAPKPPADSGQVEPVWIVNDLGELGVKLNDRYFFLYKGDNLEYGQDAEGLFAVHEGSNPEPMKYRIVGKLEFGEVCYPVKWIQNNKSERRYTEELSFIPGISFGKPEDGEWKFLPAANRKKTMKSAGPEDMDVYNEIARNFIRGGAVGYQQGEHAAHPEPGDNTGVTGS